MGTAAIKSALIYCLVSEVLTDLTYEYLFYSYGCRSALSGLIWL